MIGHLSNTQKGIILALAGYSGFAFSDMLAKFLTQYYGVYQIIGFEMGAATLVFLALFPLLGQGKKLWPISKPKLQLLRTVSNFLIGIFIVMAFSGLPLASAYTMVFAKPFIAALLAIPIYGEIVGRRRWSAIALGFLGIVIAMRPWEGGLDWHMVFALLSAFFAALMFVASRSLQDESPFALGFYPALGTSLMCVPLIAMNFVPVNPWHIPLFLLGGCGVATGILCLSLAFRMAPSSAVSPFQYSQMIWGLLFGFVIFRDIPGPWTLVGAAIVIASGIYLIMAERRANRAT